MVGVAPVVPLPFATVPTNVVLIVLDTARADVFEPYGAAAGSSPVLAELARDGASAPRMYSASGWTLPSHAALFTGMEPRQAGLARPPGRKPPGCRPIMEAHRPRLLPEVLRRAGYFTAAASCNGWISRTSGFDVGFDHFAEFRGSRSGSMVRPGPKAAARWAWSALECRDDDGATEALDALDWAITAAEARPLFWFANVVECHSPYLPPKPYTDVGWIRRLRAGRIARRNYSMVDLWKQCLGPLRMTEDELALMHHLYQRSILQLDAWLADVLELLERKRRLDDTLVIVTSDHGENFGEGGLIGHSFSLDERLIRVPFVSRGPGSPRLDRVASLLEVPRLIAEAIDLDDHPWNDARLTDGIAVAQFDATADRDEQSLGIAAEWGLDDDGMRLLFSPQTAVTDGRHKLTRVGERDQLFDLEADPREANDLGSEHAPAQLAAALDRAAEPTTVDLAEPRPGPLDHELEERMRLLGYM